MRRILWKYLTPENFHLIVLFHTSYPHIPAGYCALRVLRYPALRPHRRPDTNRSELFLHGQCRHRSADTYCASALFCNRNKADKAVGKVHIENSMPPEVLQSLYQLSGWLLCIHQNLFPSDFFLLHQDKKSRYQTTTSSLRLLWVILLVKSCFVLLSMTVSFDY